MFKKFGLIQLLKYYIIVKSKKIIMLIWEIHLTNVFHIWILLFVRNFTFFDRKWSKTVILMSYLQHRNFSTLTIGCDSVFTYVNSGLGALHKKRTKSIERLFWWDEVFQKGAKFQIHSMKQKWTCRCRNSQSRILRSCA